MQNDSATAKTPMQFALIGAAGFVAPRHLQAIYDTGHQLVAAVDPHDSVGILDRTFPDAHFFTETERFDRFLAKLRRDPEEAGVDVLTICSPNYLHDALLWLFGAVASSEVHLRQSGRAAGTLVLERADVSWECASREPG